VTRISILESLGSIDVVTSIQHEALVLIRSTYRDSELERLDTVFNLTLIRF
jgi:hypothetical protein